MRDDRYAYKIPLRLLTAEHSQSAEEETQRAIWFDSAFSIKACPAHPPMWDFLLGIAFSMLSKSSAVKDLCANIVQIWMYIRSSECSGESSLEFNR
jgi:hypothetical protein